LEYIDSERLDLPKAFAKC